jgi:hypothetical protein
LFFDESVLIGFVRFCLKTGSPVVLGDKDLDLIHGPASREAQQNVNNKEFVA